MATSNRDVKMTLSVQTLGVEEIKKLETSINALAAEGGKAAPEFKQLADEVNKLGQQATALAALQKLTEETAQLTLRQQAAATAAAELNTKLAPLANAAATAAASQQRLSTEYNAARTALNANRDALATLTATTDAAGKNSDAYRQKVQDLRVAKIAQRAEVERLGAALAASTAEAKKAEAQSAKMEAASRAAAAAAAAEAAALRTNTAAAAAAAAAAQALGVSTANVAAAQAALIQGLNASGAAAAAQRAATQAAADEQKRLADAAQAAAQTLKNAFGTLGVRSAQELRDEIAKVRGAMDTVRASGTTTGAALNSAFAAGEARIKALERELRAVNQQLTAGDRAADLFANSMGQITAGNVVADGVGYLINKVKELGAAFLATIVGGDQLRRGLMAVYKDAGLAAQQLDFLKKSSSESGVSFSALSKDFVRFSAAMNSANIPLEQSNNLFKAVTSATASLGLGVDATSGTLNALGQMASKGVVSMEELRQQLGDRLPGAIGLTAKGFGITEAQLVTLVSSGQLATRDFIVPFTEGLKSMQGETDGLVPAFERLKGVLAEVTQGAGDAGAINILMLALKTLGGTLGVVTLGLSALFEAIVLAAKAPGILAGALVTLTNPMEALGQASQEAAARLTAQAQSLNNFIDPVQNATAAMTANTQSVTASVAANTSLDAAQKLTAISTALAGDATLSAAAKIVQYNVAAAELLVQQEAQTDAFQKTAKATKEQGDTLVKLAQLTGDQVLVQETSVKAAESYSAALDKVAASQAAETAMLVAQKAELLASAEARGLDEVQIRTQTLELDKKIVASQAETDAANAAAAALRAEITTRELSAKTYRDNSASIGEYVIELNRARAALMLAETAAAAGLVTDKELEAARKRVLNATVLLNDAERDRTKAQEALTAAIRVNASLEQASLTLQMAQLKAAEAKAVADGNDFAARQARIAQKELEIKITRLKVETQIAEQNAVIAGIELSKAELNINDPLYKQKVAALDLSIKSAQAKILEAKAAGESVAGLERELKALKNTTDKAGRTIVRSMKEAADATRGAGDAAGDAAGNYGLLGEAANIAAAEVRRLRDIQNQAAGGGNLKGVSDEDVDAALAQDGAVFGNAGRKLREERIDRNTEKRKGLAGPAVDNSTMFVMRDKLNKGTLTPEDAKAVQAVVDSIRFNNQVLAGMKPSQVSNDALFDANQWGNTATRFDDWLKSQSAAQADNTPRAEPSKPSGTTSQGSARPGERVLSTQQSGPANPVTGRTVTVRLVDTQGNTRNVETTEAGADALMRTLQSASLTARG